MGYRRNFGLHSQMPTTHPVTDWVLVVAAFAVIAVCGLVGFWVLGQFR